MYTIKLRVESGKVEEHNIDKSNEASARLAAAYIPGAREILSCEKTYAPAKKGAAAPASVVQATEQLREALKAEYGADFAFEVFGKGALIAASSFDKGTVVPQVIQEQTTMPM